jgi:hypothetical protein
MSQNSCMTIGKLTQLIVTFSRDVRRLVSKNIVVVGVVAAKFFWYLLFMFLTFTYFSFYGMMAVGLTSSQQLAAVVSSAFYSIWNLFSGFLIPVTVSHTTCAEPGFATAFKCVIKAASILRSDCIPARFILM